MVLLYWEWYPQGQPILHYRGSRVFMQLGAPSKREGPLWVEASSSGSQQLWAGHTMIQWVMSKSVMCSCMDLLPGARVRARDVFSLVWSMSQITTLLKVYIPHSHLNTTGLTGAGPTVLALEQCAIYLGRQGTHKQPENKAGNPLRLKTQSYIL